MAQLELRTEGLEGLFQAPGALAAALERGAFLGIQRSARFYQLALEDEVPEESGRLTLAIRVTATWEGLRVDAIFYAAPVDAIDGFVDRAYEAARPQIDRTFLNAINREIWREGLTGRGPVFTRRMPPGDVRRVPE